MRQPNLTDKEAKEFDRWGKTPPTSVRHGTEEELEKTRVELTPKNYRLEGNKLISETEHGTLVQFIPTNRIMTGVDDRGMPVFKKIDI